MRHMCSRGQLGTGAAWGRDTLNRYSFEAIGYAARAAAPSRGLATSVAVGFFAVAAAPAVGQSLNEDIKVTAADTEPNDSFGRSVSVSGTTVLVGARGDDDSGESSGSAYLFDSNTGLQLFKLTASDAAGFDLFGNSVAISENTAVVGSPWDDDAGDFSGSAYVFDATTGQQLFKLTASDASADDNFGTSVAISGNTIIVGSTGDSDAGEDSGAAYVFDAATGQQLFKLTASDAAADDTFGFSVAVSGTIAVIGAFGDGDNAGAAYVFETTTGQELQKLTATDSAAGDDFGRSVAVSGNVAVIGATFDDDDGDASGSAYVFDTTTGQQLFKLTASDAAELDYFGDSVAISGNTAIIGAFQDADAGPLTGAAYIFDITTGQQVFKYTASDATTALAFGLSVAISDGLAVAGAPFASQSAYVVDIPTPSQLRTEDLKLTANDAASGDSFRSVGIDGNIAIVGSLGDDDGESSAGSAYLFDTITGQQLFKLTADQPIRNAFFGRSVDVNGSTALVGAPSSFVSGVGTNTGLAYIFDTTTGQQLFRLLPDDANRESFFGFSVAVSGNIAIVGAYDDGVGGSAYLFDTTTGAQLFKLISPDPPRTFDAFGFSVAISGTTAVVGARGVDDDAGGTFNAGAAYVYDTTTGSLLQKLTADDAASNDSFGLSVAISGSTAVIGAPGDDDGGSSSGSAYVFDVVTGQQLFKLTADDASSSDFFSQTQIDISGTNAVIGSFRDDDGGSSSGSAYVFDTTSGRQLFKLVASDAAASDFFGNHVAISGSTVIAGAGGDDDGGSGSGSAYVYNLPSGQPAACNGADLADPFGLLDLADITTFTAGFIAQDDVSDINQDMSFDLADINEFVAAFLRGCDQ